MDDLINNLKNKYIECIENAIFGCKEWFKNEEDMEYSLDEIDIEFAKQNLCFNHNIIEYPFIETILYMYKKIDRNKSFDIPIGEYKVMHKLDGFIEDDYFIFY
ncbi:MAG: hypothetical protein ACK4IX_08140 [Candidatus Sericytochromatia bacterium]